MRYWLVMPAAGSGRRFRGSTGRDATGAPDQAPEPPKQYAALAGRTVIEWALRPFATDPRCAGIVVALAPGDPYWPDIAARIAREAGGGEAPAAPIGTTAGSSETAARTMLAVEGGAERAQSVRRGLAALADRASASDWVLVHDAARPCLSREDLDRLIAACERHAVGGLLAAPVADTIKACEPDGAIVRTVDRSGLWRALTPQMFRYGALCAALDAAAAAGRSPTDEAQSLEWTGARPIVVRGSARNLKITAAEDLTLAAAQLRGERGEGGVETESSGARAHPGRIGSGFDVHAFGPGDLVMLGGVRIPHTQGVVAHSDGDVILHALCDALLGAAGLGDIGQHFRDDDPQWRGADSSGFVRAVLGMLRERGFAVVNADVTLLAEAPRIGKHREAIRAHIAQLLEVPADRVNVKATTTERLGFLGRREGIAAQAVVLLTSEGNRGAL